MRTNLAMLIIALSLACGAARAGASSSEQRCPVIIDRVDLSYNHAGGESKPKLRVEFGNHTDRQILTITFSLSLLDSIGNPQPYQDDLTYQDGLESGKKKTFVWDLDRDAVDIHRTGETLVLKKVEFVGSASWIDDGSESCDLTVDFHAK